MRFPRQCVAVFPTSRMKPVNPAWNRNALCTSHLVVDPIGSPSQQTTEQRRIIFCLFFFPFEPSFVDPFLDGWRDRRSIAKHAIFNERTSGVIRQHHLVPQMCTSESWASTSEVLWGCLRFDHTNQIERVPKWLFHQRRGGVGVDVT